MSLFEEDETEKSESIPAPRKPVLIYWPDGSTSYATEQHNPPDFSSPEWIARRLAVQEAIMRLVGPTSDAMAARNKKT